MTTDVLACGPGSCTLPAAERPGRLAEFEELFARSLRSQDRPAPTRLRWHLEPEAELTARHLTTREASCCAFFTFSFGSAGPDLVLDIDVPSGYTAVLDALQSQAAARLAP